LNEALKLAEAQQTRLNGLELSLKRWKIATLTLGVSTAALTATILLLANN
jgi:hypothetical protein